MCATVVNHGVRVFIRDVCLEYKGGQDGVGLTEIGIFSAAGELITGSRYGALEPLDSWSGRSFPYNPGSPGWEELTKATSVVVRTRCGYEARLELDNPLEASFRDKNRLEVLRVALK